MATCYTPYQPAPPPQVHQEVPTTTKDYSKPLHVDCSVEYELPNQAKPPQGIRNEPLLMIHPCYFRKIESQRKTTFVNHLPNNNNKKTHHPKRQPQHQPLHNNNKQYHTKPFHNNNNNTNNQQQQQIYWLNRFYTPGTDTLEPEERYSTYLSDDKSDEKCILTGKYRHFLRHHHPYVAVSSFHHHHHHQQVCYNV